MKAKTRDERLTELRVLWRTDEGKRIVYSRFLECCDGWPTPGTLIFQTILDNEFPAR